MNIRHIACLLATLVCFVGAGTRANAQNPVQWGGNARTAVDQARQQQMPLLFWVTEWNSAGILDSNDLADAQEEAFRDPIVVSIIKRCYIPIRVARNSRVIEEAKELGLPTNYGRYLAIITPDGKLLAQIDPSATATPEVLARRLSDTYNAYATEIYNQALKPVITNREAKKQDVRTAVQTVYRLNIKEAGPDLIALCERQDVTQSERAKLFSLLAALGTKVCINDLLDRAASAGAYEGKPADRDAANALARADAGALEHLMENLPTAAGPATLKEVAAYTAAARIVRLGMVPGADWWTKISSASDRTSALNDLRRKAEPVLAHWKETEGNWR